MRFNPTPKSVISRGVAAMSCAPEDIGIAGMKHAPKYDPKAPVSSPKVEPAPETKSSNDAEDKITVVTDIKPVAEQGSKSVAKKEAPKVTGLRDWAEQIGYVSAERMKNCIIFQLDFGKNPWWVDKINTKGRGFLRNEKMAAKLDADTPDDFVYNPEGVVGWKSFHTDGGEPSVKKYIRRRPRNDEERQLVRDTFGVTEATVRVLAKRNCPKCSGRGYYAVFPYTEAPRLSMSIQCECVSK